MSSDPPVQLHLNFAKKKIIQKAQIYLFIYESI